MRKFKEALFESITLTVFVSALAVLIAYVCVKTVTPRWIAPGGPSFNGYPKNIESTALIFTLIAVPFAAWIFTKLKSGAVKLSLAGLAIAAAWFFIHRAIGLNGIYLWVFSLGGVFVLLAALHYVFFNLSSESEPEANPIILAVAGIVGCFGLFLATLSGSYNSPLDVHHIGETFTSAVDFLEGGRPFVSYFWPHGLQGTGITALVFSLTSRVDLPSFAMAASIEWSLGIVSILLMAYGMGLGYYSILLAAVLLLFGDLSNSYVMLLWPVILSFLIFSKARRRRHFVLAGVVGFAAHLYRIDHGAYGFAAILAFGVFQVFSAILKKDFKEVGGKAANLTFYFSGVAIAALAMYLIFGWPGPEWYKVAFGVLPKYVADSAGFPYPLPLKGNFHRNNPELVRMASIYLVAALGTAAITSKYLINNVKDTGLRAFPVLLVILSLLFLKSAFGRSDEGHIVAASSVMYVVLVLFLSKAIISFKAPSWTKAAAVAVLFMFFNFGTGEFYRSPSSSLPAFKEGIVVLGEYGEPLPGQCSGFFSRSQLDDPSNRDFEMRVCQVKTLLRVLGIGEEQLLIVNSASLLYPALGYRLPTKYYCLGWAITPEMQKDLIAELEKAEVKAILIAKGFGALTSYDVPDSYRLPVYFKWVDERFEYRNAINTPLGVLILSKQLRSEAAAAGL